MFAFWVSLGPAVMQELQQERRCVYCSNHHTMMLKHPPLHCSWSKITESALHQNTQTQTMPQPARTHTHPDCPLTFGTHLTSHSAYKCWRSEAFFSPLACRKELRRASHNQRLKEDEIQSRTHTQSLRKFRCGDSLPRLL